MSKGTYLVTFEITSSTDPVKWDWDNFLNLDEEEEYQIHSIEQITKEGEGETLQQRADRTNPYLLTTKREGK